MDIRADSIYDTKWFREAGNTLISELSSYLERALKAEGAIYPGLDPAEMLERWRKLDKSEWDFGSFTKQVIENSIKLHHPHYIGHQVVPPAPLSALAELLGAFLNNGMAIYEMGPASTAIERLVVEKTIDMLAYGEGAGGFLTSGGSAGNLTALLTARQVMSGHTAWNAGNPGRWGIMVSAQAHYSVERAAKIMGFGEDGIIKIPVHNDMSIDPAALELSFQDAKEKGITAFAIVGNACTTNTGSYDPLNELADFAEEHGLWFHVDGAHGAAACIVSEYEHLTKGMQRADSIVIDYHKMLMTPALATAVLYKRDSDSYSTFSQDADYLLKSSDEGEWYNSAGRTLECTKLMMALRPYVLMKEYGIDGFRDYVRQAFDMARRFGEMVREHPDFELFMEPQSNIVCFRLKGGDEINARVRSDILRQGSFYIVQTKINGGTWLRTTFMNPFIGPEHCDKLLQSLKELS